jgi:hypothetical protein
MYTFKRKGKENAASANISCVDDVERKDVSCQMTYNGNGWQLLSHQLMQSSIPEQM